MAPRPPALLGIALVLVVTGCGSSPSTSSSPRPQRWDSIDARVGDVHLLHVHVDAPSGQAHGAGTDAPVLMTISNKGTEDDTLIQVASAYADRVVYRDADGTVRSTVSISVTAGEVASLQDLDGPHLELQNLQVAKVRASSYPVTFRFRRAGSVTVLVPVATRGEPAGSSSPSSQLTAGASASVLGVRRPSRDTAA